MKTFEDHFSEQSQAYAQYRPQYPAELFAYLASISPARRLAWDAGTGSGQAARQLANHFDHVVATDGSAEQIAQAVQHERVEYLVQRAEEVHFKPHTVDLVTAAMAIHWFDLESFYANVRRSLVAGGIIAAWGYHLPIIEPQIEAVLMNYYHDVLAGYWPDLFRYVDGRYQNLPFPFGEQKPPEFFIEADWNLPHLLGFLDSWSATRRYQKEQGVHPLKIIWDDLSAAWGEAELVRHIRWPLYLRLGHM